MNEEKTVQAQNSNDKPESGREAAPSGGRKFPRGGGFARRRRPSPVSRERRREFEQKVVDVRRVARVVAGGRRFNFRVTVVLGDEQGSVGVGAGKGADTAAAIEKAVRDGKKHMIKIKMTKNRSIPHEVRAKYASAVVYIAPSPGRGLAAGSSVRTVLGLAGITDVAAKIYSRSKNKLNNARAAIKALAQLA